MSNNKNDLYYLFPGQGKGKRKKYMIIAVFTGLVTAGLMAAAIYLMET